MNKARVLTIIGLLIFCAVVIIPPIMHGYVYPNIGDDSAVHLQMLDRMQAGDPTMPKLALPYIIIGYPIVWVSNLTSASIDVLFLWFSYLVLALIGITIYLVVSRLTDRKTGWLALILVLFCAQGILFQFYFGQTFNAINMGIVLPLLLFFTVRYITQWKIYQLVLVFLFGGLFGAFHVCGIYLPFFAGFATVVYVAHKLLIRKRVNLGVLYLGISMVLLPITAFVLLTPNVRELWYATFHTLGSAMAVPVANYMMDIVSPTILAAVAFAAVFFKDALKGITTEVKILVFLMSCMAVVLAVSAFGKLSLGPFRQALDLATVLALLVSLLIMGILKMPKNRMASVVLLLAVGFGLFHNLPTWFGYNSAIRPADKEAIAYVNTLNRGSYNCSAEVAPWIYDRFMTLARWEKSPDAEGFVAPILITRSLPMTPRSTKGNIWYEYHGIEPDSDYILLESFSDSKVTVKVYENIGKGVIVPMRGR